MMQNQAILAGIRALVEQIDQLERQNAMNARQNISHVSMNASTQNSNRGFIAMDARMSLSAPQGRAAKIAQRLGVTDRSFYQVAHASGRAPRYTN